MTSNTLHFDSIDASYISDPFNARFPLAQKLTDVHTISLKSLEMPINFFNIRTGMNQITVNYPYVPIFGTSTTVTIAAGNYTTVAALLTAINNAFVGAIASTVFTFAASGTKISLSVTSSVISSVSLSDTILSKYILGFRNVSFSGLTATGTVDCVLNVDNYISMYLSNVNAESTSSSGRLNISFKIPLNANNGIIYFAAENASMRQSVRLLGSGQTITDLQVVIYDRFNQKILNNNADYSFSLELN